MCVMGGPGESIGGENGNIYNLQYYLTYLDKKYLGSGGSHYTFFFVLITSEASMVYQNCWISTWANILPFKEYFSSLFSFEYDILIFYPKCD